MKWNSKRWLIATSEIPDRIPAPAKKTYKKKHWRNENGEIVNMAKMPKGWTSSVSGNMMNVYDYNHNKITKLYYY